MWGSKLYSDNLDNLIVQLRESIGYFTQAVLMAGSGVVIFAAKVVLPGCAGANPVTPGDEMISWGRVLHELI